MSGCFGDLRRARLGSTSLLPYCSRWQSLGALAHLYLATQRDPAAAEPHARLASLLFQLGQPDKACGEAAIALRADPTNATATATAARCR